MSKSPRVPVGRVMTYCRPTSEAYWAVPPAPGGFPAAAGNALVIVLASSICTAASTIATVSTVPLAAPAQARVDHWATGGAVSKVMGPAMLVKEMGGGGGGGLETAVRMEANTMSEL